MNGIRCSPASPVSVPWTCRVALFLALCALVPRGTAAQAPHLSGEIEVDMPRGMLSGDVCLSGLPGQDSVRFLLNRGLNIKEVRASPEGRPLRFSGYYNGRMVGEGVLYTVTDTLPDPRALCVEYMGAFPVYAGREAVGDFKGMIAFNGRTVRAAEQAKWYPVLFEPETDRSYEQVTYDLRVGCPGCRTIYVNGARPQPGPEGRFVDTLPHAPLLFAGDYVAREIQGVLYLNSDISVDAARVLSARVGDIRRFYEDFLGIPYGDTIVFMEHEPVETLRPGRSWGFVTWPTIAFAGSELGDFILEGTETLRPWVWRYLGHEMGHFYFGTVLVPRGPYRRFFGESTSEYLALQVLRRFAGEEEYRKRLRELWTPVEKATGLVPLDRVSGREAMADPYVYRYGPLLLVALERRIGEMRMARLLRTLVTAPREADVGYAFLRAAALKAGVAPGTWERYERECIHPPAAESCIRELGPPPGG